MVCFPKFVFAILHLQKIRREKGTLQIDHHKPWKFTIPSKQQRQSSNTAMVIPPDGEQDHNNYHREMPEEGHEEARSNVIKRKRCSDDFVNDVALAEDNDDGNLGLELEIGVCDGGERRRKGKRCSDDFVNPVPLVDDDDDGTLDLELEIGVGVGVGGGGGESRPKRKRGSEFVNNVALAVDDDDGSLGLELEVGCGGGGESHRKRKRCSDFINHVGLADGYRDGRLGLELEVVGDGGESRSKRWRVCLDLNKVYDSDQEEDYEKQDHVEEAAALISSCSSSGNYTEYYDEHDEGPDWEQEVNQDDPPKHGDDHVEELAAVVVVPDETSTNHLDQHEHGGLGTTGIDWDHCDCDSNQYLGSPDNGQVNQDVERLVSTVEEKDEEVIRGYTFSGAGDLSAAASDEDPEAKLQVKPFNFLPDLNEVPPSDHTPKFLLCQTSP